MKTILNLQYGEEAFNKKVSHELKSFTKIITTKQQQKQITGNNAGADREYTKRCSSGQGEHAVMLEQLGRTYVIV